MTKTKKKKQTEKLYCPYCGRMAVLRPAKHVYGSQNLDPGNTCMSAVVIHPVIPTSGYIKRPCALWEPWQMGICAISGLKRTGP